MLGLGFEIEVVYGEHERILKEKDVPCFFSELLACAQQAWLSRAEVDANRMIPDEHELVDLVPQLWWEAEKGSMRYRGV